jgi:hypothetical protein
MGTVVVPLLAVFEAGGRVSVLVTVDPVLFGVVVAGVVVVDGLDFGVGLGDVAD